MPGNDFFSYLEKNAGIIDERLNTYLDKWQKENDNITAVIGPLVSLFQDRCKGGKRIRGSLVKLGCELAGGEPDSDIYQISIAFEIFQTAILAHDDIIDQSDLRRGKTTMHQALEGEHRGLSDTICLGDMGFFLAFNLIATSNYSDSVKNKLTKSFSQTVLDTTIGELMDIEFAQSAKQSDKQDIIDISRLKTARYSITGPLHLGAIIGGADQDFLDLLTNFGQKLGIAYQIKDDILGIFGDKDKMGKSIYSDIQEAKQTLLITYAYEKANLSQKNVLDDIYGKSQIDDSDLEKIRKVFEDTGALEYAQNQVEKYCQQAMDMIDKITKEKEYQQMLKQFGNFLAYREK